MMRADAGLHADQARRQIGEPCFHLSARPFLSQHDRTAPIMAHDVERVLADIDADHGDCAVEFLRHGVLLLLWCPRGQLRLLAGAGARPDHPISRVDEQWRLRGKLLYGIEYAFRTRSARAISIALFITKIRDDNVKRSDL